MWWFMRPLLSQDLWLCLKILQEIFKLGIHAINKWKKKQCHSYSDPNFAAITKEGLGLDDMEGLRRGWLHQPDQPYFTRLSF